MTDASRSALTTIQLPIAHDVIAPDWSEIRVLAGTTRGSMAHGLLPPGGVSWAIQRRTVEEVWDVVSGPAEIWRRLGDDVALIEASDGTSLTFPPGTDVQCRTIGDEPFQFIMVTMPFVWVRHASPFTQLITRILAARTGGRFVKRNQLNARGLGVSGRKDGSSMPSMTRPALNAIGSRTESGRWKYQ